MFETKHAYVWSFTVSSAEMGMTDPGGRERCPSCYLSDLALVRVLEDFQLTQLKAHFKGEDVMLHFPYKIALIPTPD